MSAIRFNNESFKESLFPLIRKSGLEKAYLQYIYPLLEKSRILWQTGSLSRSQEQFIRNSIKQIIIVEDNDLKSLPKIPMITAAMINTSGNLADNNFLFYRYALRKRGFNVIFTGGILPVSEVSEIYKIRPFDYLIVNSNTLYFERNKISYFNDLIKSLNISKIIFTDFTNEAEGKLSDKIISTKDPAAFIRCIDAIN
jgi:MerR family transcriptional regulator, light-induced transcriptional regulator